MNANANNPQNYEPLATRMRPRILDEYVGQAHLLGSNKPLRLAIQQGVLHSMIFWGPPGTGKTTLAQLIAKASKAHFVRLSAVFSGVKEIRKVVDEAITLRQQVQQATILFIDEIHRFNKAQQDVFLPYVENGTFILIGATTENPSFELNNALLSRARVYVLKPLSEADLLMILNRALKDKDRGYGHKAIDFPAALQTILTKAADGDARQVLNLLEILIDLLPQHHDQHLITEQQLTEVLQMSLRRFDKQGESFYDLISALHKSVRGSAPDAALYWYARMLDGGCDPRYIARRVMRMANEDIGLAEPRAIDMALHASEVYERLGSPEGELAITQVIVYLACAPKSNAVYLAYQNAVQAVKRHGSLEVPLQLRNAPTKMMKDLGYGDAYRYAHDEPHAYAAGEQYLPKELTNHTYYQPTSQGLEAKISDRLAFLKALDKKSAK